jgi:membrane protein DedA with SNARE-associated domain
MQTIIQFILRHGYSILFGAIFVHQIGFPLPGPLFLIAAGALAADGKLDPVAAVALSVAACVLADWPWYEAGRRGGGRVLHFVHSFAPNPDAADRKTKERFARYGPYILLVSKFVPGLDAVAPPMAGTSRTSRLRFLSFDALGAALYSMVYVGAGYIFRHDLDKVATYAGRAGRLAAGLAFCGLVIYVSPRVIQWRTLARRATAVNSSTTGTALSKLGNDTQIR